MEFPWLKLCLCKAHWPKKKQVEHVKENLYNLQNSYDCFICNNLYMHHGYMNLKQETAST